MKIRKFDVSDFIEVVAMYKDFVREVYAGRKLGADLAFFETVMNWIKFQKHINITTTNDEKITGFSVSYVNFNDYVTEPVYCGEIAYVKPMYRGGKSAYLLYHNMVNVAENIGLIITANAFISDDNVVKIQQKLGGKPKFIIMEKGV